mmetsp:Transcript_2687/g.8102  ORF Transcript_2687/g.8102 Transcript_2687/m.8102 type:complete len:511 (+) Transcript_2687:115-1647(+)|eukprot:CAMPEP_0198727084 /NCGR_PEP_ID=MMETSP1475-20131203/3917_1 /TAXON_ID= ORGANISM="Unidentified sp., Strain CCMP1999" /NCGR_SAMPLE_ID=MMETSP1475 /ASSEMBLY_ACC=CAM_ASM_001111 /LENGTH=510 /DNA_ID=CAMNT_0044489075 /DNA_START=104 /DNA_END=1636 /DNA_ORIENTATION=+
MAFVGGLGAAAQRGLSAGVCGGRGGMGVQRRARRAMVRCSVNKEDGKDDRREQEVLRVLRAVIDPDLGKDIVTLGFVKNVEFVQEDGGTKVKFDVELTTPACPVKDKFREDCKKLVESLPWVSVADVNMTAMDATNAVNGALRGIRSVIAVASCKGGVGKSTTAVNLAYALSKAGAKVGLMDADIYGPSLPTMIQPEKDLVEFENGLIKPLECNGVKLMSFGYVNSDSAIMRGPMIANMLTQLLTTTNWGELDYLVVDMPPGTGDVQLTLSQTLNMTAAVIVTTPQKLAFVDVVKGLDMFNKVNVPSIAVVENMSYFEAPDTGKKHYIFGSGYTEKLRNEFGIQSSFAVPIDAELAEKCDNGVPYVTAAPQSQTAKIYDEIAEAVVREVARIQFGGLKLPRLSFDQESSEIVIDVPEEATQRMKAADLRRNCRCAVCIDEMTGVKVLRDEDVPEDVRPRTMRPVGNYATQIEWSDGHSSLYPYKKFVRAWKQEEKSRLAASVEASEPALA